MNEPTSDPSTPFTPRHTGAQRLMLGFNIVVVLACVVGAGVLLYGKSQADLRLQTPKVAVNTTLPSHKPSASTAVGDTAATTPDTFPTADPQAQNFLITGSDANACVSPNSPWAGAADPARDNIGSRSDTIMLMRVDPTLRQAAILSFPRDLWVKIGGRYSRINSAYVRNDYSKLAQTLYDNFGVKVDHYIQIDFCAFKRIVDGVGGVKVPFLTPIIDPRVGINITHPGCHTFSGDEALAYVRSRHLKWVDANGVAHEDRASDLGRISRQQDFLRRVLQTALDKGMFDPKMARALLTSLQTDIVTEAGFTLNDMLKFAGVMRDVQPKGIKTYQIEAGRLIVSGQDVLQPYTDGTNMKAILAIFQGRAALASAPAQVFDTTTTATASTATGSGSATTSSAHTIASVTTTTVGGNGTTTTVAQPTEIVKGDILPPKNVHCD
jgi:LCP family protein required for cell wall assembly